MKRVTDDPLFSHFNLFGKAQRKLAGIIGEGFGDFEHHADFVRRQAVEGGVESDGEVGLNKHFVSPVRGVIAMPTASQAPRRRAR